MTKKAIILALKNQLSCCCCRYCTIGTIGYKCQLDGKRVSLSFPIICKDVKLHYALEYGIGSD